MIVGTGIDIEEVARIRAAIERHGRRFIERIFTSAESAYAEQAANPYERYTTRFAAKEAIGCVFLAAALALSLPLFLIPVGVPLALLGLAFLLAPIESKRAT